MNGSINIKFWGVRGSTPCANDENMRYGGNTTCVQMKIPNNKECLIFDCGTGFRNLGNKLADLGSSHKGRVFITHPHWDHLQGFPFFKPFYNHKNWFRVYLPPQGEIGCEDILKGHMSNTFFPVSMDMLEADLKCETMQQELKQLSGYTIEYMWATHTVPTAMYKIRVGNKTIVFAPDNELMKDGSEQTEKFLNKFRTFIHGIDLLIHDAQFDREQYKSRVGWGHSAWEDVIEIAKEENVQNLHLTHHDPDNDDEVLSKLEKQIVDTHGADFESISLAKEGQEISLPCEDTSKIVAE